MAVTSKRCLQAPLVPGVGCWICPMDKGYMWHSTAQCRTAQESMAQPDGCTGCVVLAQVSCPVCGSLALKLSGLLVQISYTDLLCLISIHVPRKWRFINLSLSSPSVNSDLRNIPLLLDVSDFTGFPSLPPTSCRRSDPEWGQKSSLYSPYMSGSG